MGKGSSEERWTKDEETIRMYIRIFSAFIADEIGIQDRSQLSKHNRD